jgi:hypothetical protein
MTDSSVPDSIEALRHAQASVILSALDDWLRAAPAREVRFTRDSDGVFRVVLVDSRESRGESLRDACGQVCTVLLLDMGEVTP